MIRYVFIIYIFVVSLYGTTASLDKLNVTQDKLEQSLWFNKGVLELKNKNYKEAIYLFQKTKKFNKYPSLLNIAIARYHQKNYDKSIKLFKLLTTDKIIDDNIYVYIASNMYLYKLSKDKNYLKNITKEFTHIVNATDRERNILIDTYIQLDKYQKAELIIDQNTNIDSYKKGILALINNNLDDAQYYLEKTLDITYNKQTKLDIYWFLTYIDLKLNNMSNIVSRVENLRKLKDSYFSNDKYELVLDINSDKYDSQYYLNKIQNMDLKTKIDLVFYFTSYLFGDDAQTQYSITNSFFLLQKGMLDNLDNMTQYNKKLLNLVQGDPYILRDHLKKFDIKQKKSYMYFNLGLAHATVGEYKDAMEQFNIALNLKPANRLYSLYILLCAKLIDKTSKSHKELKVNLTQSHGENINKAKILNKFLLTGGKITSSDVYGIDDDRLGQYIEYLYCIDLKKNNCSKLSFFDDTTDPIKNILYLGLKSDKSNFYFISNIQDNIQVPKKTEVLPSIVSEIYINYFKGVGLSQNLDKMLTQATTPLAIKSNYNVLVNTNRPNKQLSDFLKIAEEYDMNGKDDLFLQVAAALKNNKYDENAYIILSLINTIYSDNDSSFLIGLRYLKSKDFDKALEKIKSPFNHEYIDFRLNGLNQLVKEI